MTPIGIVHTAVGFLALGTGAAALCLPKGGRAHRALGYAYAACMVTLNATAFGIYNLLGTFGPFHALALVSLATLTRGMLPAIRRRPGWLVRHYMGMGWSYIGLCAATASEAGSRLPFVRGLEGAGVATVVATGFVLLVGAYWLGSYRERVLREVGALLPSADPGTAPAATAPAS